MTPNYSRNVELFSTFLLGRPRLRAAVNISNKSRFGEKWCAHHISRSTGSSSRESRSRSVLRPGAILGWPTGHLQGTGGRGVRDEEEEGGLAGVAQGITPFSPSMAAREARLRPCGPASAH
jgi:hypothetical protein